MDKPCSSLGVLISSEAGHICCWSLYGERKDMGMFYGPSKAGESICAMSTDANNHHLICADTTGEVRIWNIENYCCSTTPPIHFETSPPPLVHSWQAHLSPIIYCEWTDYKGHGDFILTGATDHTARLWTMNGEEIGIFGQRQQWDIDLLLTTRSNPEEETAREQTARNTDQEENSKRVDLDVGESFLTVSSSS